MTEDEWAEKLAHIYQAARALNRAKAEHAANPGYETALAIQELTARLTELRSTIPPLRVMTFVD